MSSKARQTVLFITFSIQIALLLISFSLAWGVMTRPNDGASWGAMFVIIPLFLINSVLQFWVFLQKIL